VSHVPEVFHTRLTEPAETTLFEAVTRFSEAAHEATRKRDYRRAFAEMGKLQPVVAKFFDDVLVMADEPLLREARLSLVGRLRDHILEIADISEIVTE
jgi:glycyl-tRNA synthetase beta subunit